jgi:SAM-dependent methyltransferase
MSAEGPVRKPSSEPPDVDSLMSRLDGEGSESGDRISDPDVERRPSAAELLGGRGRRTKRTIRVPDDAVPAATPSAAAQRRSTPPPAAAQPIAPAMAKDLLQKPSLFDATGRITPQRIISVGDPISQPPPWSQPPPPTPSRPPVASAPVSSEPVPAVPPMPAYGPNSDVRIATSPKEGPQPTIPNLDAQVREALALLDREDFETSIDISVGEEDKGPPSNEEDLADEEVEVVATPAPSKKVVTAPNPPPRRASNPAGAATATLPSAAATDPISQPSIVVAAAATVQTPAATQAPITAAPSTPAAAAPTTSPSDVTSEVNKKKKRQWFEELFNDDYARTLPTMDARYLDREVGFIEDALGCDKGATILDLGCGPGEQAVALATRGYEVIGIDLSLAMLARASDEASEKNQRINFLQGDMRDLTFDEAFDGIYCWGTTFGYFDDQKNAEVIQKIHRALRRGGRFLLDVVNRDYITPRTPSMVWFEGDGCVCMDEAQLNAITSRLVVKRTMMMEDGRQREIEYSIRLYALHELGKLLHDNGFRVVEASGDTSTPGNYFGAESPRILILAEKR